MREIKWEPTLGSRDSVQAPLSQLLLQSHLKGPFIYYVITDREGGVLSKYYLGVGSAQMITIRSLRALWTVPRHLVQLQLKSTAASSALPCWTWTWPWWTWEESVVAGGLPTPAENHLSHLTNHLSQGQWHLRCCATYIKVSLRWCGLRAANVVMWVWGPGEITILG